VDKTQVSISGLSSGGVMATQMHVAYSSAFKGAAIIAGCKINLRFTVHQRKTLCYT